MKVLPDKVLNIGSYRLGRLIDARMTVAEHVGLECQKVLHGFSPRFRIAIEFRKQGGSEILAEQDSLAICVNVE